MLFDCTAHDSRLTITILRQLTSLDSATRSATSKRVLPSPVRRAVIEPPWRSTIDLTIHSPRPRPPGSGSCSAPAIEAIEDRTVLDLGHARAFVLDPDRHALALR